ncbi:MAG: DUF5715 family protein [Longimicrobiales bacterium]
MARALSAVFVSVLMVAASPLAAQSLKGSTAAMQRQHRVARQHDFTFIRTSSQARRFASLGLLVPFVSNQSFGLAGVSFPYGRPALRTFVERLAGQYRSACGERLIITSLTRPLSYQPRNSSELSVHPAGMAVDLRASRNSSCRRWLERTLLSLEKQGLLDATRERFPAHYHVALFPTPYLRYVQGTVAKNAPRVAAAEEAPPAEAAAEEARIANVADASSPAAEDAPAPAVAEYKVNRGDSLWSIARRYGTSVEQLKQLNNLLSSRIDAGQVLTVPAVIQ